MNDKPTDDLPYEVGNKKPPIANQFGQVEGNKNHYTQIKGGNRPWSIRNSLKYLAGQTIDQTDKEAFKKLLPPKPTVAQLIAANSLAKATKADMRAVEYATEQVDGKLANVNLNQEFAQIPNMTEEQINERLDRFYEQRANQPEDGAGDDDGAAAPGDSETPA